MPARELRRRHHDRIARRAQPVVEAVDLVPRRCALRESEVADHAAGVQAAQDRTEAGILSGFGRDAVAGAFADAHGAGTDAEDAVRRSAPAAPETAGLARQGVVPVPQRQAESAASCFRATDLDAVRARRVVRRGPVVAVTAEIHEMAAAGEEGRIRVQHPRGGILGVAARHEDLISVQERSAGCADVVVGDDVVGVATELAVEEFDEPEVGGELPSAVEEPHGVIRPHVEDGAFEGGKDGAGAVVVAVVEGDA